MMKLPVREIPFRLLTPCFCGGAQHEAELRVPSIRGQIRFWHGERFDQASLARVWGAVGDKPTASQIAVTAKMLASSPDPRFERLLPHADPHSPNKDESKKANSEGDALLPGDYHLTLRWLPSRPPPENPQSPAQDWTAAQTAVRLWLLIGAIGLRSNRAAGSVWPINPPEPEQAWVPQTEQQLADTLNQLGFAGRATVPAVRRVQWRAVRWSRPRLSARRRRLCAVHS